MVFNKKIDLLKLVEHESCCYCWHKSKSLWANLEHQNALCLFSSVGVGAKRVVFTLAKRGGISPDNAVSSGGRHYFINEVNTDDPPYMSLTCADIQPIFCTAMRNDETEGLNKSSVMVARELYRFPAYLTEKYRGFEAKAEQLEPMTQITKTFVLVTPKPVILEINDLVLITDGAKYAVSACHMLGEYKNEYEVVRKDDA